MKSGVEELLFIKKVEFEDNTNNETKIKFENGEVWELDFKMINGETRLIWKITIDNDGNRRIQIDERGYLKNKGDRKKAMEAEINTYYIKIK